MVSDFHIILVGGGGGVGGGYAWWCGKTCPTKEGLEQPPPWNLQALKKLLYRMVLNAYTLFFMTTHTVVAWLIHANKPTSNLISLASCLRLVLCTVLLEHEYHKVWKALVKVPRSLLNGKHGDYLCHIVWREGVPLHSVAEALIYVFCSLAFAGPFFPSCVKVVMSEKGGLQDAQ